MLDSVLIILNCSEDILASLISTAVCRCSGPLLRTKLVGLVQMLDLIHSPPQAVRDSSSN
jgi:hypothetical protein